MIIDQINWDKLYDRLQSYKELKNFSREKENSVNVFLFFYKYNIVLLLFKKFLFSTLNLK